VAIYKASIDLVLRDLPDDRTRATWLSRLERLFPKDKLHYDKTVKYRAKRRQPFKT
jgi:hypothetical protein